jgi:hypothetical protein
VLRVLVATRDKDASLMHGIVTTALAATLALMAVGLAGEDKKRRMSADLRLHVTATSAAAPVPGSIVAVDVGRN